MAISGKMSAKCSLVSELRRTTINERGKELAGAHSSSSALLTSSRNTQEQLRLDHIETLEVLETVSKENKLMKAQIETLKQQLAQSLRNSTMSPLSVPAESTTDIQLYIERIASQEAELKQLRNQLSALQLAQEEEKEERKSNNSKEFERRKQMELDHKKQLVELKAQIAEKSETIATFADLHKDFDQLSHHMLKVTV